MKCGGYELCIEQTNGTEAESWSLYMNDLLQIGWHSENFA